MYDHPVAAIGHAPLLAFLLGLVTAFVGIRISVRLIRARVPWWPRNITVGGVHVHHAVFGVALLLVAGIAGLAVQTTDPGWRTAQAGVFGLGAGLVLDETALLLHMKDVYWTARGRASVDVVFAAVGCCSMILAGLRPFGLYGWLTRDDPMLTGVAVAGSIALAVVTILKGKVWTCLVGVFVPPVLVVGAVRLARPHSPWAGRRYAGRNPRLQCRAGRREGELRAPVIALKVRVQDALAGRHDHPDPPPHPDGRRNRTPDTTSLHRLG